MVIFQNNITEAIGEALNRVTGTRANWIIRLAHPEDFSHGDYATNVAFLHAKELHTKPREFAEKLVAEIRRKLPSEIEKVEVAGAGFINFFLSKEFFAQGIAQILKEKEAFGTNEKLKGKKVMVEYTDPNPFKEFHIGHLMNNAIGESISRLIEAEGAEVKRACYQGDVGLHVAKAIWGKRKLVKSKKLKVKSLETAEWGRAYAFGAEKYETDAEATAEIEKLNKIIYERSDAEVQRIYEEGKKASLKEFERLYQKLGTRFDFYFFESEMAPRGAQIVRDGVGKGIFEESDLPAPARAARAGGPGGARQAGGAIVFKGEKHGLHTRVFINSQGLPTYEAKELALAKAKSEIYPYDISVVITGNEVNEYFRVLLKAMALLFPELAKKTVHRSHGMLRLPSGKMSSRKGGVIDADALIAQVEAMVREKIAERGFGKEEETRVAEAVAVGAIKYSILRQNVGGDIIFDFEKSISFEGDSGPYLQYSYARAHSVLRKADTVKVRPWDGEKVGPSDIGILERLLCRLPEVVERAASEYEPHYLATYLIALAGVFNHWYAKERILDAGEETPYRLAQTQAFTAVMKNGLWLLGISAPVKM